MESWESKSRSIDWPACLEHPIRVNSYRKSNGLSNTALTCALKLKTCRIIKIVKRTWEKFRVKPHPPPHPTQSTRIPAKLLNPRPPRNPSIYLRSPTEGKILKNNLACIVLINPANFHGFVRWLLIRFNVELSFTSRRSAARVQRIGKFKFPRVKWNPITRQPVNKVHTSGGSGLLVPFHNF